MHKLCHLLDLKYWAGRIYKEKANVTCICDESTACTADATEFQKNRRYELVCSVKMSWTIITDFIPKIIRNFLKFNFFMRIINLLILLGFICSLVVTWQLLIVQLWYTVPCDQHVWQFKQKLPCNPFSNLRSRIKGQKWSSLSVHA